MAPLRRIALLVLAGALAGMLIGPAAASAARWPGRTITFWDASGETVAVNRAIAAWNASGINMRFVRASTQRRAQVVIVNAPNRTPSGCGTGTAQLGYVRGIQARVNIAHKVNPETVGCSWPGQTLVVAHELGHILGLGHLDRRCAVMNSANRSGISPSWCFGELSDENVRRRIGTWRCRVLEPIDVARAVRIYGGTVKPARIDPWCRLFTPLPAPAITATVLPDSDIIQVTATRPTEPAIPRMWIHQAMYTPEYELHIDAGSCATAPWGFELDPGDSRFTPWQTGVKPGMSQTVERNGFANGAYCVAVWARDALGKPSTAASTATVTVAATPNP